jgi:hypothetical protein
MGSKLLSRALSRASSKAEEVIAVADEVMSKAFGIILRSDK